MRSQTRWDQLGAEGTAKLLEREFGISMPKWAAAMGYLHGFCNSAGIMLNDVEFCVARKADAGHPTVFLIDFDKVSLGDPSRIHPDEGKKSMFPHLYAEYEAEYHRGRKFVWQEGQLESLLRGAREACTTGGIGDSSSCTLAMGTRPARAS